MGRGGPKIVGGRLRGRSLPVVGSARPTEGRVREALFNIWAARLPGCRFLDLFAGSGAMGFEALSRGAAQVTWVEKHGGAAAAIRRNAEELADEVHGTWRVVRAELPGQAQRIRSGLPWDLIYADPPYAYDGHAELLRTLAPQLAAEGTLAIEHARRVRIDGDEAEGGAGPRCGLVVAERRQWGDCAVTFFHRTVERLDGGGQAA